jgi:dimethylaniline monooxygenase (N-oxide forming)
MSAGSTTAGVAVIGAGSSGLAVLAALRRCGIHAEGFERGSEPGGQWRYQNDNGLSGAYESLRTNVSRPRMQYPGFPMPDHYPDFPSHRDMASYLDAYADASGLRDLIRFRSEVRRLEPEPGGGWWLTLDNDSVHRYRAVVVATGVFWSPRTPEYPGSFAGDVSHSHHYRRPDVFAGQRVLVVGGGQSASEIAVEVAGVTARTFLSVRHGVHVVPRWIGGRPYDAADVGPLNRVPWRWLNRVYAARVRRETGQPPTSWPQPHGRLLEGIPIVSSDLLPAVRRGDIVTRPAIDRLLGDRVGFVDGSEEYVDRIVYATGYRIALPFLTQVPIPAEGRGFPLYRRIVAPGARGLFFCGFIDAPGGLLPVVQTQGEWIAAVLAGRVGLPPAPELLRALGHVERRTRERFPGEGPHSIRCDPHAYRRLLESDLRRARRGRHPTVRSRAWAPVP